MMTMKTVMAFMVVLCVAGTAAAQQVYEVEPGQNYRPMLERLEPGDELVFLPGVHEQNAIFELHGTAEAPITIRGRVDAEGRRPEIRWTQRGSNLWEIGGEHIHIRDLKLHNPNHYAIRVRESSHITIENVLFRESGAGLSANHPGQDVHALHVRDSQFIGNKATDLYIGTHEGRAGENANHVTDFLLEGCVIDGSGHESGSTAQRAIQLKHDVDGTIRRNFMAHTRGPTVHCFGIVDVDSGHRQVVEQNILVRGGNRVVLLDGGHVTVRQNVLVGGTYGGFEGRVRERPYEADVCAGLVLVDNIIAANETRGDLRLPDALVDPVVTGNRIFTKPGEPGVVNLPTGDDVHDNVEEEAADELLHTLRSLHGVVPDPATATEVIGAMVSQPPASQQELIDLLRPLLD